MASVDKLVKVEHKLLYFKKCNLW